VAPGAHRTPGFRIIQGKSVDQLSPAEKINLYGIILDGVAGGGDLDFFANKIAIQMEVEEGRGEEIDTIKRVINKEYPISYK
jgi:hypothetical protein